MINGREQWKEFSCRDRHFRNDRDWHFNDSYLLQYYRSDHMGDILVFWLGLVLAAGSWDLVVRDLPEADA